MVIFFSPLLCAINIFWAPFSLLECAFLFLSLFLYVVTTEALRVNIKGVASSMPRSCLTEKKTFLRTYFDVFTHQEIQEGIHRFDFDFELPNTLPQSFESMKGHIRYRIKAVLDVSRDSKFDDSLHVTVKRIDDLNLCPSSIVLPYTNQIQHEFGYKGRLNIIVSLPHLGFTPGQTLTMSIHFKNDSSVKVVKTKITFEQIVRHASDESDAESFDTKTLYDAVVDGCEANTKSASVDSSFTLPEDLQLTSTHYCSILQIFYELRIRAIMKGFHNDVSTEIPIIIGSIPIDIARRKTPLSCGRQRNMSSAGSTEKSPLVGMNRITIDQEVNPFPPQQEMSIFHIILFVLIMFAFVVLVIWSFNYEDKRQD